MQLQKSDTIIDFYVRMRELLTSEGLFSAEKREPCTGHAICESILAK